MPNTRHSLSPVRIRGILLYIGMHAVSAGVNLTRLETPSCSESLVHLDAEYLLVSRGFPATTLTAPSRLCRSCWYRAAYFTYKCHHLAVLNRLACLLLVAVINFDYSKNTYRCSIKAHN